MEGEGQLVAAADGHRFAVDLGQYLGARAHRLHVRRADERHRHLPDARDLAFGAEAVELAAVGVAAHGHGDGGQVRPVALRDALGQKDHAGAGGEHGQAPGDALAQRLQHAQLAQQLALHGAFAAGEHERVEGFLQVRPLTQLDAVRAQLCQLALVLDEGSLHRQHGDDGAAVRRRAAAGRSDSGDRPACTVRVPGSRKGASPFRLRARSGRPFHGAYFPRSAMSTSISCSLMPTMASPRSSESAAKSSASP